MPQLCQWPPPPCPPTFPLVGYPCAGRGAPNFTLGRLVGFFLPTATTSDVEGGAEPHISFSLFQGGRGDGPRRLFQPKEGVDRGEKRDGRGSRGPLPPGASGFPNPAGRNAYWAGRGGTFISFSYPGWNPSWGGAIHVGGGRGAFLFPSAKKNKGGGGNGGLFSPAGLRKTQRGGGGGGGTVKTGAGRISVGISVRRSNGQGVVGFRGVWGGAAQGGGRGGPGTDSWLLYVGWAAGGGGEGEVGLIVALVFHSEAVGGASAA